MCQLPATDGVKQESDLMRSVSSRTIHTAGRADVLLLWSLRMMAVVSALILVLIVLFLVSQAMPALHELKWHRFWSDLSWHPSAGATAGQFNIMPMLAGTLLTTLGAILLAGPLGIASALFSVYYAPASVRGVYRHFLKILTGVPSVVYGFWGLVVLAPILGRFHPPGQNLLTAILVLSIMILPTVALLSDMALRGVRAEYLQAAHAMGFSRSGFILGVAMPVARPGIAAAVLLAVARAMGETMAVLMVAGNVVAIPSSLFDPVRTLTANIALELGYAMDFHRSTLYVSGLLLMAAVCGLVLLVALMQWATKRGRHV